MVRVGVTGHSDLTIETRSVVSRAIKESLSAHDSATLVGVSCLARGADQVFARAVLDLGGALEVVLPAADYRERKVKPDNAAEFDDLISRAATITTEPFQTSGREAYFAASHRLLSTVDEVIAVWDGKPSGGLGGTADVVAAARAQGIPLTIVWPEGAARGPAPVA